MNHSRMPAGSGAGGCPTQARWARWPSLAPQWRSFASRSLAWAPPNSRSPYPSFAARQQRLTRSVPLSKPILSAAACSVPSMRLASTWMRPPPSTQACGVSVAPTLRWLGQCWRWPMAHTTFAFDSGMWFAAKISAASPSRCRHRRCVWWRTGWLISSMKS